MELTPGLTRSPCTPRFQLIDFVGPATLRDSAVPALTHNAASSGAANRVRQERRRRKFTRRFWPSRSRNTTPANPHTTGQNLHPGAAGFLNPRAAHSFWGGHAGIRRWAHSSAGAQKKDAPTGSWRFVNRGGRLSLEQVPQKLVVHLVVILHFLRFHERAQRARAAVGRGTLQISVAALHVRTH